LDATASMVCQRCNALRSESDKCPKCGMPLKTLRSQKTRGWVAFGAGAFLAIFMGAIWIWVDRIMAQNAPADAATATFMGRVNVSFALIVIAGILGIINGWMMAHSGRRNTALIVALLICFVAALFVAWTASNGYHPAS
jgi:ribosomal protein L40E